MRKLLIAAALVAAAATAFAASNRPSGFTTICSIGESCTVSGATNVAFGAADQFVFKTLSGTFTCSVATFGSDPIPSKSVKECSVNLSGAPAPSPTPAPAPSGIQLSATAGNGQVSLNWSYSGVTVGSQEIFRDTDANPVGRVRIASVSQSTRTFTATGLTNGVTVFFYIKNTLNGVVTNSNAASATPSGGGGTPTPPPPSGGAITGATCTSTGSVTLNATMRITSGTFDGGCRTFNPGSGLGDGSQDEGQDPAFRVENGATLRNAILGNNGVDGVHFYNSGNLQNFRWTNIGEDAFTVKSSGTVNISGVSGFNGEDKFGQVNAASTVNISNCIVDNAAKFIRQNGDTTFRIAVTADRCQISNMKEGIFRTDSSSSTARLTNSRLRNSGSLCIGPWASCTGSGNTNF